MYRPPSFKEDRLEVLHKAISAPWNVTDAPEPFVTSQIRGIIGLEIPVAKIEGKWKVSQNRPEADRKTVMEGLHAEGGSRAMAELVADRGPRS